MCLLPIRFPQMFSLTPVQEMALTQADSPPQLYPWGWQGRAHKSQHLGPIAVEGTCPVSWLQVWRAGDVTELNCQQWGSARCSMPYPWMWWSKHPG